MTKHVTVPSGHKDFKIFTNKLFVINWDLMQVQANCNALVTRLFIAIYLSKLKFSCNKNTYTYAGYTFISLWLGLKPTIFCYLSILCSMVALCYTHTYTYTYTHWIMSPIFHVPHTLLYTLNCPLYTGVWSPTNWN